MKTKRIILILFVVLSFAFGMKDLQSGLGRNESSGWSAVFGFTGRAADPVASVSAGEGIRRVDYVDADGKLTFNKEKNYASMVQELDADGRAVREFYYDEEGMPAEQYAGHCGVAREWVDGRNVRVTYLDRDGRPFVNSYDYAAQRQSFYEDGKTRQVMYLGLSGEPVKDRNGEYGIEYEYNEQGWTSRITSLDADGRPMQNAEGYVYVDRMFYENGELRSLRYYKADGTPAAVKKGVYGTENVGSRQFSLGADGKRIFRINDFLNNDPWIVFVIGLVLAMSEAAAAASATSLKMAATGGGKRATAFAVLMRHLPTMFVGIYALFILYETVFTREGGNGNLNFTPFWSYRLFFSSYRQRLGILDNIWLFVPLGAGLVPAHYVGQGTVLCPTADGTGDGSVSQPTRQRVLSFWWVPLVFACGIELAQLVFGLGYCEFDDVFSNTLGGILGMWIAGEVQSSAIMKRIICAGADRSRNCGT